MSIFNKLFKGYNKGPVVFTVPNLHFQNCAVNIYSSYFNTQNKYEFDQNKEHIKYYGNETFEIDNDKIILIGHPCKHTYKGLLHNGNNVLTSSYFRKTDQQVFDVCFGLLCDGFKLFIAPYDWREIAHENITFFGDIATEFDIMLPKVHSLFSKIYAKIYIIIENHKLGDDLFLKIFEIYERAFSEINDSISDKEGKAVAILYLSDKIEYLTKI